MSLKNSTNKNKNINEDTEDITDLMFENELEHIDSMMKKIKKDIEFEIIINNTKNISNPITSEVFTKLIKFIMFTSKKLKSKVNKTYSLDISLSQKETVNNFRLSIDGVDNINTIMKKDNEWQNHLIYQKILSKYIHGTKGISMIKKSKIDIIDIESMGMRARLASEDIPLKKEIDNLQKLRNTEDISIRFRLKERISLTLLKDNGCSVSIDLTMTKGSKNINTITREAPNYELEVEITGDKEPSKKIKNIFYKTVTNLMKTIQGSNHLINKPEVDELLLNYASMLDLNPSNLKSLAGRNPITLEIQHVVDSVANKYAVTDKADGERFFLIIFNSEIYLISNSMRIKRTGIMLDKKYVHYNNTILDGEYIFLKKEKRSTFMAFDCLYLGGEDIRKEADFLKRLEKIDKIIEDCFVFGKQKNYKLSVYSKKKYDNDTLMNYYSKEIINYLNNLNHDIELEKDKLLIRKKFFIPVLGINDNEIFKYSTLLWNKYVLDSDTQCPYILDGLIYHPLQQKYTTSAKESKLPEYKWKPADKNSIDFYITFVRDRQTDEILTLFDNSTTKNGKAYRIAHLQVGRSSRDGEYPSLFRESSKKYIAYIFLTDGETRDIEGDIIQDSTVVEFYYANDPTVNEYHRWVPMRTRHDKTQMVKKYRKKYGNFYDTADKIWRSIISPVTIKDINILANDQTYNAQINILRGRVSHDIILAERREDVYYNFRTNLGKPMRNFHNFIKSITIYLFCNMTYNRDKKLTILDLACGVGGDIMKFYYSRTSDYVGIDINNFGLINPTDGALSRYKKLKNRPNFPRMTFINADATAILDPEHQIKALGGTTDDNLKLMKKYFSVDPKKRMTFDCINCQFALHYFLESKLKWNNFLENINMYLNAGGFALFTCFDAQQIVKALGDNDTYTSKYTDNKGNLKTLLEIKKKFKKLPNGEMYGAENPIDVHNALIQREDEFITEYLVDKDFLIEQFDKHCNMELVETELFENLFHMFRDYFMFSVEFENNKQTADFLKNAAQFYDQKNEVNKAAFNMTKLNRYYIFKRRDAGSKKKIIKPQSGGGSPINLLNKESSFTVIDIKNTKYSFLESLLEVLKTEEIVPNAETVGDFKRKFNLGSLSDHTIDDDGIEE